MRGNFGLFKNANAVIGASGIVNTTKIVSCSGFSTSSSGGGSGSGSGSGRGRGRGGFGPSKFDFVASQSRKDDSVEEREDSDRSVGRGHGRGKAMPSGPHVPSFNTFVASNQSPQQPGVGRGRGGPSYQRPDSGNEQAVEPKKPIFLAKDQETGSVSVADSVTAVPRQPIGEKNLPSSILDVVSGFDRGKPERTPVSDVGAKEENRHLRPRQAFRGSDGGAETGRERERVESRESSSTGRAPKMSREEAVKKAVGVLSRPEKEQGEGVLERESGGGRGRGRGRGKGARGKGRGRRRRVYQDEEEEDDEDKALYVGDDADGENFAKFLGPEKMNELTEAFEEMSSDVLPDPEEEEYIEALDTNLKIELEPEYLLGDLETNPDIDEKPPISLREAFEKMKPFLVAYEGIENQEEWEEVVKEAMERVPLLKEIVDHYCGPDTVTAKQQQEELERVAKTLPASAPDSVKRFTNRAVLSLQSNPGWGFDRKCQFMDKLVSEFSKSYK